MKKTVLITGASHGIGRETALIFAAQGYNVAVNYYRSEQEARELLICLDNMGCASLPVRADVSDKAAVTAMQEKVTRRFGAVDVLVNNAGIAQTKLFTDITAEDWHRMFAVHVDGIFNCLQAFLPQMISQKNGKIINVSSIWGLVGASCEVHYSAAKAAVIGLTKALAKEVGPSHVQVNCVAPGVIDTAMNTDLDEATRRELEEKTPLRIIGSTRDIAETILFLASDKADFITGQVISPNGGFVI